VDAKSLRELGRLMRDYDLAELEYEEGDMKVRLSKQLPAAAPVMAPMAAAAPVVAAAPAAEAAPAAPAAPAAAPAEDFSGCKEITSPVPGTVYLKPNPESASYVTVGGDVSDGTVVCLVEAMKVFNEIKSEGVSGTIKKICVEDGQAVEYGTVLFLVG
jgi:acetyl-CoA carboxylase biotin carboxyl carrier protein